ncbi:MAG TPA: glutaminyl-peptide cyclotransferase [Bacteroidetes bacterium]|nr:glutaminyl-peptide cyclotransferase [Bacteroidota bacterium]
MIFIAKHGTRNWATAILFLTGSFVFAACGSSDRGSVEVSSAEKGELQEKAAGRTGTIRFLEPSNGSRFHSDETVKFSVQYDKKLPVPDSVAIYADSEAREVLDSGQTVWTWDLRQERLGIRRISVRGYREGRVEQEGQIRIVILSATLPVQYGYRVVRSYPHDREAYTQGLIYDKGFIYESTGQYGQSSLRKVDLETGEVLNMLRLSDDLFAEGICLYNNRIIQLTWTSRVGFVYDKESFRLINKIHYPTQGWGLTTNGTDLIMSDGTQIIYFLEPDYFTELHRIEVYDHRDQVNDLNELEYIRGEIWANVYQTDLIVRIDPKTGRVTGVIDLAGLLPARYQHPRLDVLNGIAWDSENDRLFVTGKMWPLLFEIELVEKTP